MDIDDDIGEAIIEGVSEKVIKPATPSLSVLLISFFTGLGACIVFALARGKNSYAAARRYHNSPYYGIGVVFILLTCGLVYWCWG
ncbi:MAG TPA: hypothetical protein PLW44_03335 [Chitinophagales bacterium]|nr:hypothetical protein [Chitinophagales bacterium]